MVISKPRTPPQPQLAVYGADQLQLFPRLTRASYMELHGGQAPAWSRERRIKRWFDTSVLEGLEGDPARKTVRYDVFDPVAGTLVPLEISAEEASRPNLPGALSYPKHQVAPTRAVVRSAVTGEEWPLNPALLCEHFEAAALARELGLTPGSVGETVFGGAFFSYRWNGETRRPWVIHWGDAPLQAALLIAERNRHGVGAPGHWDKTGREPVWIPEAQGDTGERDPRPEIPVPVRRLLPGENFRQAFGGVWMVVRTDLTPPPQDELLGRIDRGVARLLGHFNLAA